MALSGTTSKAYFGNSHYWIYESWSATQSTSGNYSTVTATLYFGSDSGWNISGSNHTFTITINGSTYTSTHSPTEGGGTTITLGSYTHQVNHDTSGNATLSLSGTYNLSDITITSNLGTASCSGSWTLNQIPRKSSLSSSCNFTAGNNLSCTISKQSSSFTTTLTLWVQNTDNTWNTIQTVSGITGTSYTFDLTSSAPNAKTTSIFNSLKQGASCQSSVRVETFDGGTSLGYTDYYGTCSAPSPTKATMPNFNIGSPVTITLNPANTAFTHKLDWSWVSYAPTIVSSLSAGTTTYSWNTANTDSANGDTYANLMYKQIPNAQNDWGTIKVTTYYGGVQVQSQQGTANVYGYIVNSTPTFGTGYTYIDNNSATVAITGDSSYIIQNHSDLQVTIPTTAFATAKNFATMSSYNVSVNGVTKSATQGTSNIVLDFGQVNAGTNQSLTVTAIDSRGFTTTTSITVKMLQYFAPVITATVARLNGFENEIDITLSGSIAPLTTTSQKNALTAISGEPAPLEYCYAENISGSTYTAWTPFTYTTSGASYTATGVSVSLDNTKSYIFQIRATDKLQTSTQPITVSSGQPVFFVDFDLNSVGVGKFPTGTNTLETNGSVNIGGSATIVGSGTVDGTMDVKGATTLESTLAVTGITTFSDEVDMTHVNFVKTGGGANTGNPRVGLFDRNAGSLVNQLGNNGGSIQYFDVVDSAWTKVLFRVDNNGVISTVGNGGLPSGQFSVINQEAWTNASLQNSWTQFGGGYPYGSYMKDSTGMVVIRGAIKSGTLSSTVPAFTLPVGYRPQYDCVFNGIDNSNASCAIYVRASTGYVCIATGANAFISLEGIRFQTKVT